jgi:hypothetical protein
VRRPARWLPLGAAVAIVLGSPAFAAEPPPPRQAIVFLLPGLSYAEARAVPGLDALARAGGIGLMTTRVALDEERSGTAPYVTVGAGAAAGGPRGPLMLETERDGATLDIEPFEESAEGSEPGALGEALGNADLLVSLASAGANARGALVAMDGQGRVPLFRPSLPGGASRLLRQADVVVADLATLPGWKTQGRDEALQRAGLLIADIVTASPAEDVLVLVVAPAPSGVMLAVGDTVTPLLIARGTPDEILTGSGDRRGATSDTTRHAGVVANVDVAPTILRFFGVPVPDAMVGSEIRAEGEPPDELYERFLDRQRIRFPVQLAVLGAILAALIASVAVVAAGRRAPQGLRRTVAAFALVISAAVPVLLPASLLPSLSYQVVLLAIFLAALGVAAAARIVGGQSPFRTVAVVALVWVGIVIVDGALGFPSRVTALWGSGVLDGARFFGMTNTAGGILIGGTVLAASRLRPGWGVLLLFGAAFFAGLPWTGANLGEAVALFVAAGLWLALSLGDASVVGRMLAAVLTAAGATVLLVLIHVLLAPEATHIGEFATEASGSGPGALVEIAARRAEINLRIMRDVPAGWLVVGALLIWLCLAFRRTGRIGRSLARDPAWRRGVLVLATVALVGFVVNDSGIAVAGPAFAILTLAILYPAMVNDGR